MMPSALARPIQGGIAASSVLKIKTGAAHQIRGDLDLLHHDVFEDQNLQAFRSQ